MPFARRAPSGPPDRFADLLDRLLERFGAHYAQAKRAVSGLDFEDLEL